MVSSHLLNNVGSSLNGNRGVARARFNIIGVWRGPGLKYWGRGAGQVESNRGVATGGATHARDRGMGTHAPVR